MKDITKEMNESLFECQRHKTARWYKNMPANEREGAVTVLEGVARAKDTMELREAGQAGMALRVLMNTKTIISLDKLLFLGYSVHWHLFILSDIEERD